MENILSIVYGIAWILGAVGAALSVIYVVYSGYLFMSSQGDPQRMAQARTSIIGVAIGLVLIGGAFIIPTTISRYVIEPAGGVRVEPRAGADCDGVLKDQLVVQRTVGTPDKMQFLISKIQGRRDECSLDLWNPVVKQDDGWPRDCPDGDDEVGSIPVPDGLRPGASVVTTSSRDADNNIIVYWAHPDDTSEAATGHGLPSDGSVCWLHVAAFGAWTEEYCRPGVTCPAGRRPPP